MALSQMYLEYNDPVRIIWRAGTEGDEYVSKIDTLRIINNKAVLSEIPSKFDKVKIAGYAEVLEDVYRRTKELANNEFYVNYSNGIVQFNSTQEDRSVTCDYKGRGMIQYPAERIYAHNKRKDDVVENLQTIIDESMLSINDAEAAINQVNIARALTEQATSQSKIATDNAILATDSANTAAQEARYVKQQAIDAANSTINIYVEPVQTYAAISTTYPNPANGTRVMVETTGDIFRYDGINWPYGWKLIENYAGGAIPLASRVSTGLMNKDDFTKFHDVLEYKTIMFVVPTLLNSGAQRPLIQFPFNGTIAKVQAYCTQPTGTTDTFISVEKAVETDFISDVGWINCANIDIPASEKKSTPTTLLQTVVNAGEYFRLNISSLDTAMTGLTVQVDVKL